MMKKILMFLCAVLVLDAFADTETIKWYVDGNVYNTTTCSTGGDVNLPATQPTKRGYAFAGWKVALYDFSTLDYTKAADSGGGAGTAWSNGFSYGKINGKALCSVTAGSAVGTIGTPDETTTGGAFCWCKVTGFQPTGENIIYGPETPAVWVYSGMFSSNCNVSCGITAAGGCPNNARSNSNFRKSLFGIQ